MTMRTMWLGLAALCLLAGTTGRSEASLVIQINQVGPDVVATAAGSLDLTGLDYLSTTAFAGSFIAPNSAAVATGDPAGGTTDNYTGISGPESFGPGGFATPSSGSGDIVYIEGYHSGGAITFVWLPQGYGSGHTLSGTATWDNTTLGGLGAMPGTYTYTWGNGGPSHTITVRIGASVPEPSTLLGCGLAFVALAGYRLRKRTKVA